MGNLLAVVVHAANIHDTKAGIWAAKLGAEAIGTASEYGQHFPQVFKTITVDNGNEFAGFAQTEAWGSKVFLAHPYTSWERAQNERHNGLFRSFVPKGVSIELFTR